MEQVKELVKKLREPILRVITPLKAKMINATRQLSILR